MTSGTRTKAMRREQAQRSSAALASLERRRRRRLISIAAAGGLVVAGAAVAIGLSVGGSGSGTATAGNPQLTLRSLSSLGPLSPAGPAGPAGPEGVPVPVGPALANTAAGVSGTPVDGISCQAGEQAVLHIHAHLSVFVDGAARQVPAGIGVVGAQSQATPQGPFVATGSCFYWLHTHAADGIIHVESPILRTYTLGDVFDVWGQPLTRTQVGPETGAVVVIYNSKRYEGDPRNVPLTAHAQIQIEVRTPRVAPAQITFPKGL